MSSSLQSHRRSRAIEQFIVGIVLALVGFSVTAAVVSSAMGLKAERDRVRESARAEQRVAQIVELVGLQKDIRADVIQVQQWLTDVSATRGLNGLDDGWAQAAENAESFKADSERAAALAKQLGDAELGAALEAVGRPFDAYYQTGQRMAHAYVDSGPEAGNAIMSEFDAAAEAMSVAVEATKGATAKLVAAQAAESKRIEAQMLAEQRLALLITGGAAAFIALGGVAVIAILRGRLLRPLSVLGGYMGQLADGDYEDDVPFSTSRNELGEMARSIAVFRTSAIERRDNRMTRETEREEQERLRAERDVERRAEEAARQEVVRNLAEGLSRLSDGDVAFRIDAAFAAEYEALKGDFNAAASKLQTAMQRIAAASTGVGVSATEIASAADDLSRRTEHQAASLEETAAALDEITATVKQTADRAAEARTVIAETRTEARETDEVVAAAVGAVTEIEAASKQISQIIGVIDEIAFQTNLLALNAGVEAARAGEAGRGFAVVASEVRALAQRSAEAAKEIKGLISESSEKVAEGVDLVGRTGKALGRILQRVEGISDLVMAISTSTQEQSAGLSEVNTAVNEMDRVTQQNAAMVEETTAAAHSLREQFGELSRQVDSFRIAETDVRAPASTRRAAA